MSITQLPVGVGVGLFVLVALALSVGPFVAVRSRYRGESTAATITLAGQISFRIGALHGLIVALVFADLQGRFNEQRRTVESEAAATANLFYDLERFGGDGVTPIRADVAGYTRSVIDAEWPLLDQARLSPQAWELFDRIYDSVLNLAADSQRRADLRRSMLDSLNQISKLRQARLFAAADVLPVLFWVVAILGFALTAWPFLAFSLTPMKVLLIGGFAGYTGVVLYFIAVMNNPFNGVAALEPRAFETLFADAMAGLPAAN